MGKDSRKISTTFFIAMSLIVALLISLMIYFFAFDSKSEIMAPAYREDSKTIVVS